MDTATINVRLRPIKLAFLVEPTDRRAILEAIRISSTLWGGSFNPIIPVFSRTPSIWKRNDPFDKYKGAKVLSGYLDTFDPDFVVLMGKCAKRKIDVGHRRIISIANLLPKLPYNDGLLPDYGTDIFEVLADIFEKELKFARQEPMELLSLKYPKKDSLFFASVFGEPLPKVRKILGRADWMKHMEFKEKSVDFSNYTDFLKPGRMFIRRLLYHKIDIKDRGENCLFYMDANNPHDVIDYLNLRAIGWTVIPIAKQAIGFDSTKRFAKDFIERYSGPNRHITNDYIRVSVLKARSIDDPQEIIDFIKTTGLKNDPKTGAIRWGLQKLYPRMWDEWARDKDGATCSEVESKSERTNLPVVGDTLQVKAIDTGFNGEDFRTLGARFANVIDLNVYSSEEMLAEAIPDSGEKLTNVLSGIGLPDEWRFSKRESVYFARYADRNINVPIPKAEDVFIAWMQDNGFGSIKLSPSGRIAKQMTKQLGGKWGLSTLANKELIDLLREMENGKEMDKAAFLGRMGRIANASPMIRTSAKELVERYVKRKMFQLGASVQCPICMHHSWYPVNHLKYQLQCTNCADQFDLPSHDPDEIKWAYRTFGPFSIDGAAEGAYTTLLTLRSLSANFFDSSVTPLFSFLTDIDGGEKEIDLGMLFRESRHRPEVEVRPVFAECKTYKEFQKKDVDKMAALGARLPGSVLIFATLKDHLNDKEKKLLRPLVNRGRREWKTDQPYNPVLILTQIELFSSMDFHYAWQDAGGRHAPFGTHTYYTDHLLHVCDATQQLYLGMKSRSDDLHTRWERKVQRMHLRQQQKGDTPPGIV